MKAIILARVSTEEQKEAGNSLPAQQARLIKYIDKNDNLKLGKQFIFDESAYKEHRKEFEKVLDYIKDQKEVVAFCCDKVDRLTRDFLVGLPMLEKLRRDGKIELHFPSDNLVLHKESPATDLFHFNIAVSLAQYYSNAISDNVKRALEQKLRQGEWIGHARIGYIEDVDENGRKTQIPDPQRAHLITKMFELYATGQYSFATLKKEMDKLGLVSRIGKSLSVSMVAKIIEDRFYCGIMTSKGKDYIHNYQRLVSNELYLKCQDVRTSWNKKPFQYSAKPFIFRGLLKCANCGCTMTPEIKKGKFVYYSCTNGKHICKRDYVPEKTLLKPVYEVLDTLNGLEQGKIDEIVTDLKKSSEAKNEFHNRAINGLQKEYNDLQIKIDRLLEFRLDGSITKDIYDKKFKELKERQYDIGIQLEEYTKADENYHITANTVLNIAKKALEIFESSEPIEKRQFLNYLLQNPVVKGKKLEFSLRKPFDTIVLVAKQPVGLRR